MNRHLYIIGAGGLGKELGAYIKHINSHYLLAGFYDDAKEGTVQELGDIAGSILLINKLEPGNNLLLGVGIPSQKKSIIARIKKPEKFNFPSIIQPNVYLGDKNTIKLGKGTIIGAGSSLTNSIDISDHVLVNLNCTIGHDVRIGKFTSIMPGANISGNVSIGDEVLVGAGATILQGLSIGDGAIIGAGSVVINDVAKGATVKGVPAT